MKKRTDKQRLDALQKLLGSHSDRCVCRWSTTGRGWRLHEHQGLGAVKDVRQAIDAFLDTQQQPECEGLQLEQ